MGDSTMNDREREIFAQIAEDLSNDKVGSSWKTGLRGSSWLWGLLVVAGIGLLVLCTSVGGVLGMVGGGVVFAGMVAAGYKAVSAGEVEGRW
jgi:hypothetical protein